MKIIFAVSVLCFSIFCAFADDPCEKAKAQRKISLDEITVYEGHLINGCPEMDGSSPGKDGILLTRELCEQRTKVLINGRKVELSKMNTAVVKNCSKTDPEVAAIKNAAASNEAADQAAEKKAKEEKRQANKPKPETYDDQKRMAKAGPKPRNPLGKEVIKGTGEPVADALDGANKATLNIVASDDIVGVETAPDDKQSNTAFQAKTMVTKPESPPTMKVAPKTGSQAEAASVE
jgi:hypothetical protein